MNKSLKIRVSEDRRGEGGSVRVRIVGGSAAGDGAYSKYLPEIVAHALTLAGAVAADERFTYTLPLTLS